jgi:hypothetical protein
MSKETDDFLFDEDDSSWAAGGHPQPPDPVESLSWALLDEQITDDEIGLLDTLLLSDASARSAYVGCVQLHNDLLFHFGDEKKVAAGALATKSPVLGFLNDAALPFGVQPPNAKESRS